jgi:DNA-binding transcriptional LysR family regulator
VEIIDSGNLSQAARKLKMTRANVSYHLTQLEKGLGVQLVKRTTRRVEPTEWAAPVRAWPQHPQRTGRGAGNHHQPGPGAAGRVGISVPSGYGQIVMSDWLIEFKRLYPASCWTCCSRTGPTTCATRWTSPSA